MSVKYRELFTTDEIVRCEKVSKSLPRILIELLGLSGKEAYLIVKVAYESFPDKKIKEEVDDWFYQSVERRLNERKI